MNLQQLRYVRALAECRSFVGAADLCRVTQPTLSNGIAQLEEELGIRLFARTTRSVSLTENGELLFPAIADVLNAQALLIAKAHAITHPEKQLIRIGVSPLVGIDFVSVVLEPFLSSNSNVEVVFRELNLLEMMRLLEIGQLELVFGPVDLEEEQPSDRSNIRLYEEPLVFIAKKSPDAQNSGPVTIKEIADQILIMVPDTCGLTRITRSIFKQSRLRISEYSGAAMSYGVLQEWAHLGIGAAILPRSKIKRNAGVEILLRKGDRDRIVIGYQASWQKSADTSPIMKSITTHLKTVAPAIASGIVKYAADQGIGGVF